MAALDGSCCAQFHVESSAWKMLDEMDFERGISLATLNGDMGRMKHLIQKIMEPSQPGLGQLYHSALCQWVLCYMTVPAGKREQV